MRIVFMGTPAFALPVLVGLLESRHEIVAVYTRPDRRVGRGKRLTETPVKAYAAQRNLTVYQPGSLHPDEYSVEVLEALNPEVIVVAAYGVILPSRIVKLPALGCLNVHPSLLPKYRGATPVPAAILNGDDTSGVTLIKLDEGMDTGPIIAQREASVYPDDTTERLTRRLFEHGATLLIDTLPQWAGGDIVPSPQDEKRATVTRRLSKKNGEIDWMHSAPEIERQIRAYYPWPGSYTRWNGKQLKIITAFAVPGSTLEPGVVFRLADRRVAVGTGGGIILLKELQIAGKQVVDACEFVLGRTDFVGSVLGF